MRAFPALCIALAACGGGNDDQAPQTVSRDLGRFVITQPEALRIDNWFECRLPGASAITFRLLRNGAEVHKETWTGTDFMFLHVLKDDPLPVGAYQYSYTCQAAA